IVAASATGAWEGWDNRVARYIDGTWRSYLPGQGDGAGWLAYVIDEAAIYVFDGTGWGRHGGGDANTNRLLNGGFDIFQTNGGAPTARSDNTSGTARCSILTQPASVNISRQADQENGQPFNVRLTQNQASAQRAGLAQIVASANARDLRGK